jgi:hypothetical protein
MTPHDNFFSRPVIFADSPVRVRPTATNQTQVHQLEDDTEETESSHEDSELKKQKDDKEEDDEDNEEDNEQSNQCMTKEICQQNEASQVGDHEQSRAPMSAHSQPKKLEIRRKSLAKGRLDPGKTSVS